MFRNWVEPETVGEALDRKRDIVAQIEEITLQLGDKRRFYARANEPGYWAWRQGAKVAWVNYLQELRLIKQWLRERTAVPA